MIDHLRVHRARREPLSPAALMRGDRNAAMALRPFTDSVVEDVGGFVGEQVRHLVPQAVLGVLGVGTLQLS